MIESTSKLPKFDVAINTVNADSVRSGSDLMHQILNSKLSELRIVSRNKQLKLNGTSISKFPDKILKTQESSKETPLKMNRRNQSLKSSQSPFT